MITMISSAIFFAIGGHMSATFRVLVGIVFLFLSLFCIFLVIPNLNDTENTLLFVVYFYLLVLFLILFVEQIAINVVEYLQIRPVKRLRASFFKRYKTKKCLFCS